MKFRNIVFSNWIYRVVRFVLGTVFIWSGASKIMDINAFAELISMYELVPEVLLVPTAVGLPVVEAVAGIGLIKDDKYCLWLITGMLLLFTGVLWFGILKGLEIDCGCFSTSEKATHKTLWNAFYRDIFFIIFSIYLHFCRRLRGKQQTSALNKAEIPCAG